MKFIEQFKFTTYQFTTEEGIEYRTDSKGSYWERLYGESWEPVFLKEEDECNAALADVVIALV